MSRAQLLASNLLMREQGSGSRRVVEIALEKTGLQAQVFQESDEPRFHRSDQVRRGSRTRHRLRFALGHLQRTGTRRAESCRGCRPRSGPPFFADLAHRPGTSGPGRRLPNIRAGTRPASRHRFAKAVPSLSPPDKLQLIAHQNYCLDAALRPRHTRYVSKNIFFLALLLAATGLISPPFALLGGLIYGFAAPIPSMCKANAWRNFCCKLPSLPSALA